MPGEAGAELRAQLGRRRRRRPGRRRWRGGGPRRSGSQARAPLRATTSRQVLTTSRWSQVENCDSPRNWRMRVQSLASDSCAASRASSGLRSTCRASRSTAGACRSQRAARALSSPSFARRTRMGSLSLSYRSGGSGRSGCPIGRERRSGGCIASSLRRRLTGAGRRRSTFPTASRASAVNRVGCGEEIQNETRPAFLTVFT